MSMGSYIDVFSNEYIKTGLSKGFSDINELNWAKTKVLEFESHCDRMQMQIKNILDGMPKTPGNSEVDNLKIYYESERQFWGEKKAQCLSDSLNLNDIDSSLINGNKIINGTKIDSMNKKSKANIKKIFKKKTIQMNDEIINHSTSIDILETQSRASRINPLVAISSTDVDAPVSLTPESLRNVHAGSPLVDDVVLSTSATQVALGTPAQVANELAGATANSVISDSGNLSRWQKTKRGAYNFFHARGFRYHQHILIKQVLFTKQLMLNDVEMVVVIMFVVMTNELLQVQKAWN